MECLNCNHIGIPLVITSLIDSKYCAYLKGITYPHPASHENFNNHPSQYCWTHHPQGISTVVGCNVHNGMRDPVTGMCSWCLYEIATGAFHNKIPHDQKMGFSDDEGRAAAYTARDTLEPTTTNLNSAGDLQIAGSARLVDLAGPEPPTQPSGAPTVPTGSCGTAAQIQYELQQLQPSLSVLYPTDAMNILDDKADMIGRMLAEYSPNIDLKAGWDWLSSEAKIGNQEDISFFTGILQTPITN